MKIQLQLKFCEKNSPSKDDHLKKGDNNEIKWNYRTALTKRRRHHKNCCSLV